MSGSRRRRDRANSSTNDKRGHGRLDPEQWGAGIPNTPRREESTFRARDGLQLFERRWLPDHDARANIVIVHGYAEHSGRYDHVCGRLAERGYAAFGFDLRGHGRSAGPRALVRSFAEYLIDLDDYVQRVRGADRTPTFVLGHSMGGTIVALWAITGQPHVAGIILSGSGLTRDPRGRVLAPVLDALGRFAPSLPLARLDSALVSRDEAVVHAYDADPLVYRGRIRAGLIAASLRAARRIERAMEELSLPILILHGAEDGLADPEGSRRLYERARSSDKRCEVYEGLYHEIFNEPEQVRVLRDVTDWLDARTARAHTKEERA